MTAIDKFRAMYASGEMHQPGALERHQRVIVDALAEVFGALAETFGGGTAVAQPAEEPTAEQRRLADLARVGAAIRTGPLDTELAKPHGPA